MSAFGTYLLGLRQSNDMSLSEAADLIGCTKTHLHDMEKGRSSNPSIRVLAGIACAYEADLGEVATMAAASCAGSGYHAEPPKAAQPVLKVVTS